MKVGVGKSFILNLLFLFANTRKVLFSGKFIYFISFAILYDIFLIIIMNFTDAGAMPVEVAFYMMNLVPTLILTVYLSMTVVSFEKENNTIETMFAVPGSPYKVWIYKLLIMYALILFIQFILVLIVFFFVGDFSFFSMLFHAYVPIFMVANMTFYFSTKFKSGYAAGLISLIVLFFNFILADAVDDTAWFLYQSPFNKPNDLDPELWNNIMFYNKFGIILLGFMFLYLGLRKLLVREPFID